MLSIISEIHLTVAQTSFQSYKWSNVAINQVCIEFGCEIKELSRSNNSNYNLLPQNLSNISTISINGMRTVQEMLESIKLFVAS